MPGLCSCPVCLSRDGYGCTEERDGNRDATRFRCDVCGEFSASRNAIHESLPVENVRLTPIGRAVLSHRIRATNDAGRVPDMLMTDTIDQFIQSNPELPRPTQQVANCIRILGNKVRQTLVPVRALGPSFHASIGAPGRAFALKMVRELADRGLLALKDSSSLGAPLEVMDIDLSLAGWELFDDELRGQFRGSYGFIALKFGDAILDPLLNEHIKPAIKTLGYDAYDMRDVARAGVIDNLLRVQIRDAAFVIVDLTHENAGAYWEAGYAEGLGKPVLYICEKSKFEERKTHFDTNHCTTVLWDIDGIPAFTADLLATIKRSLEV